jgi:hypothetical protein
VFLSVLVAHLPTHLPLCLDESDPRTEVATQSVHLAASAFTEHSLQLASHFPQAALASAT